jgi:hypothetical protein
MVDLRRRFSNPEVRAVVGQATQAITRVKVEGGDEASPGLPGQRWRLIDRLGEQIIREMLPIATRERPSGVWLSVTASACRA